MKRALVISGGGAKGAWAGGLVQYLIEEKNYDWDMYFGSSTGSLVIPLTSLKEMERLKEAYINVDNDAIFSLDPFTKKGKINIWNAAWRIIRGKTSLGESNNLHERIKTMFTEEDFDKVKENGKDLFACAVDYTEGVAKFAHNKEVSYNGYVDATWASTSVPLAMDLVEINGSGYLDGGVIQHVPIQKAIDMGADEIDVIVLRPKKNELPIWEGKNMLDVVMRTLEIMDSHLSNYNVLASTLIAHDKDVKLRIRYTPYDLTPNIQDALIFDKKRMIRWWEEGYEFGKLDDRSKKIYIKK